MLSVVVVGSNLAAQAHVAAYSYLAGVAVSTAVGPAAAETDVAEIVDICVSGPARTDLLRREAGRGKQVLVTPPLAAGIDDADWILKTVKRRHGRLAVTHSLRFHPVFARVKEIVSGGSLGAVRWVNLHRDGPAEAPEAAGDGTAGCLFQDLDFCHWLLDGGTVLPEVSAVAVVPGGGTGACRLSYPSAAVVGLSVRRGAACGACVSRQLAVECELGAIACRVTSASWLGDTADTVEQCELTRGGQVRHIVVPDAAPLPTELGYRVGALACGDPWLCPTPAEARAVLALNVAVRGVGDL